MRRQTALLASTGLVLLVIAGVTLMLHAQQVLTGNLWGVPLDDSYIHFRFAQNLAAGRGFAFNPGVPMPASTSPLWVLLLALAAACGIPLWLAAKILGVMALIAAAILAWRLARSVLDNQFAAWAVGALTALDGRLLWAAPSGMEVTLFTALSLAVFLARPHSDTHATLRYLLVALLCGLATLTRPEGYLLTAVVGVDLLVRSRPLRRVIALPLVLYVILVVPYIVFCLVTTGEPLPTTFYAKASAIGSGTPAAAITYLLQLAYIVLFSNILFVFAAPGALALWLSRGAARALVAWPVLLVIEQAILSPVLYHYGRYVMPLQPFFALWLVAGIVVVIRPFSRRSPVPLPLTVLLTVAFAALMAAPWTTRYADAVENIDDMHVRLAQWIETHVPPGMPIALNDVGAMTYIAHHPAVDIEGLVTPTFIRLKHEQPPARRARDELTAIERAGARYLIIFPYVYPDLARLPALRAVYSVTLRHPVIVPAANGTARMVVYRINGPSSGED